MAASRDNNKIPPKRKRGRPATGHDPHFAFRIPVETIKQIDAWAAQQPDKPSRAEAVRRLIDLGMKAAASRGESKRA
jgi:hypothetical protein